MKPFAIVLLLLVPALVWGESPRKEDKVKDEKVSQEAVSVDKILGYYELAEANRYTDRKTALKYAEQCGQEAALMGAFKLANKSYFLLGLMHQKKKNVLQPKAAVFAFEKAAEYAEKAGLKRELLTAYKKLAEEYAALNQSQMALSYYKKYTDLEENKIHLRAQKLSASLEATQKDVAKKEEQISSLEDQKNLVHAQLDSVSQEKLVADLEIKTKALENEQMALALSNERNQRNVLIGSVIFIALVLAFLFYAFVQGRRSKKQLTEKNKLIEVERNKSDDLLLNILPIPVANELKEHGKTTPQHYDQVTVLFSDFESFTKISEQLTPIELVNEIDYCFRGFDKIISRYHIEKIKTIGDAYLCVSGLPTPSSNHCNEILSASLEMRDFVIQRAKEREKEGKPSFHMRIGIHTGPLVAGVVGSTKFVYDVWGDTVNTAARMEQNCEVNKINVSADVNTIADQQFKFKYRGKLEAKNKGVLDMYYLERKVTDLPIAELNEQAKLSAS